MEFLMGIARCWGGLPILFVFSMVVFFHELGHFLVARWGGVRVLVFSIGFGPELFGFNDRRGTRWKISAIPLGGYVKFLGDENAASVPDQAALAQMSEADRREAFEYQKVGTRAAIVAAGPIANFLLAIVIFASLAVFFGKPSTAARVDAHVEDERIIACGSSPSTSESAASAWRSATPRGRPASRRCRSGCPW